MSTSVSAKKTKSRQPRASFTYNQISAMETIFQQTQYPDPLVLETLSRRTAIPLHNLCTWFQNRRSRFRKESKKNHISWMRGQLFESEKSLNRPQKDISHVLTTTVSHIATTEKSSEIMSIHPVPGLVSDDVNTADVQLGLSVDIPFQYDNFTYGMDPVTSFHSQSYNQPMQMTQYSTQEPCVTMNVNQSSPSVYSYYNNNNNQTSSRYMNTFNGFNNQDLSSWAY